MCVSVIGCLLSPRCENLNAKWHGNFFVFTVLLEIYTWQHTISLNSHAVYSGFC